ncbi:hypothetical protein AAC387_Pa05g0620 [Persea americana]
MGTISQECNPIVHDLRVSIHRSSTVYPSGPSDGRSMFLSNIDQVLNFDVETIHFFAANPDFPAEAVGEMLEEAVGRLLVAYDFLAGRLKYNLEEERLEIECNGAGVGFSVGSSELELEEIGDLVFPNPAFRQLVAKKSDKLGMEDRPLMHFQVTFFKCGGFAIGISSNHTTMDGISAKMFFENLASLAHGRPLSFIPCNNRRLLAARSPPQVTFSHPELLKLDLSPLALDAQQATILYAGVKNIDFKLFRLSGDDIAGLKLKAKAQGASGPSITGFNVVAAHIWRCKVLATMAPGCNPNDESTVLYAVDLRLRLKPPLPQSYNGNAVLTGYGSAKYCELEEGPFATLVEAVREGAMRVTDEYARSVIDWGQLYKGFPRGDVMISSWWRLGFAEVDYPWGRPIYSCPVMIPNSEIIVLFPDKKGMSDNGVNVCVALPTKNMVAFERLFYKYLG